MYFIKIAFYVLSVCIPVKKNGVLFMAFHGRGLLDNPGALYNEMKSEGLDKKYSIVWVANEKKDCSSENIKTVKYQSVLYFYYLARSRYWIFNCKLPEYIHKKPNQIYIQTWHGTPLKRLGRDLIESTSRKSRSGRNMKQVKDSYTIDAGRYNLMISPNAFCTEVFQSAFGVKKDQLIEVGYPRNDVLCSPSDHLINSLKEKHHIPHNKKVLLYAPTWRDDSYEIKGYNFQLELHFEKWKKHLPDYLILFKPHYFIINSIKIESEVKDYVRIMDPKSDINELYLISDCLVTDYSSVFFDYALLKRPIYFYMYDLEKYQNNLRGFYLDIYKDLPGDIYQNEDQLIQAVKEGKYDYERLSEFNARFNNFQDQYCSRKIVKMIFEEKQVER